MLRHLAGGLDDDELLAVTEDSGEITKARLQIALKQLALGNRDLALEHLDKCAAVFAPFGPEASLVRAIRDRMKYDDQWPNWP